jgi:hypothetical protein
MPFFDLIVSAEMENLYSLQPLEPANHRWFFKMKCNSCGETSAEWTYVDKSNVEDVPGGRGSANYVRKCKACGESGNASVVAGGKLVAGNPRSVMVTLECRGLEPAEWSPQGEGVWLVTTTKPTDEDDPNAAIEEGNPVEEAVTIEEGEWCGYDEATERSLMLSQLAHFIERSKRDEKEFSKMERQAAKKK